jgi:hypothetical protein
MSDSNPCEFFASATGDSAALASSATFPHTYALQQEGETCIMEASEPA